ncbi:MAG: alpha/beta hydrolase [Sphingomonadales bacterium]|nr:alpha/beta hydrolase [Sphingomonadales bacterium]
MESETPPKPQFLPDGTVVVPGFTLPVSTLLSEPAAAFARMRATMPSFAPASEEPDVTVRRDQINAYARPGAERMRESFPVTITRGTIAGVEVMEFTPEAGVTDPDRVLINLHGGAFCVGWDGIPMLESIPIASLGGWRVVSVNYRMAPEHRHPAGVQDVAAVYAALLQDYAPGRIGIYGGSAGGVLTAQAAAWLPAQGLPQCGAIGIFGAGGVPFESGESMFTAGYIDGSFPAPRLDRTMAIDMTRGYFDGVDDKDPSAWPGWHLDVLAQFPPTLVITGTRAMDLSPAVFTNSQLLKAGVRSTLIVGESQGHCFHYQVSVPEGRDACDLIVRFFRENLN